ncbi:MAG: PqqD family protein [Sphingomonas sp.]|uniref:PqqD family protein n=1 Tax=Sphingomonas sp. TaxID=28214 RepID=UPI00179685F9|nr:PqqD family protein [Sphingomonas sp.]MBA3666259.1 PqqD family protein [Sphingomonas sp.]
MTKFTFSRSSDALFTRVGDDIVALHLKRGQCFGMENVTRDVWDLLSEPTDLERICDRLTEIYDVEPAACRTEVEKLLAQLVDEGLVDSVSS